MTIKIENLTFPTGEFSHTELAEFNKLDRKKVWTAYQKAIADGIIKSSGNERKSGKGKAAALWIVSDTSKVKMSPDSVPVPVIVSPAAIIGTALVPAKPGRKPKVKKDVKPVDTAAVVTPATVPAENVSENVAPAAAPFATEMGGPVENTGGQTLVEPATAPVVSATVTVVEVAPLPPAKPEELKVCISPAGLGEITATDIPCPFCKTPLLTATTANGGTRVWCGVNDIRICSCSENPYGYSNNVKNAVEILTQKFWENRS